MQVLIDHVVSLGGYAHPGLDLASPRAEGGRGVVATARVAVGEQLLLVPMAACIRGPTDEEWARHQVGGELGCGWAALRAAWERGPPSAGTGGPARRSRRLPPA